mmetsp:Transcript_21583/g.67373  ORF Transcript_21583/g.67373 Transcript_21583/m.67373 type:complete len:207 (-) Transcript_21583:219-839(-)
MRAPKDRMLPDNRGDLGQGQWLWPEECALLLSRSEGCGRQLCGRQRAGCQTGNVLQAKGSRNGVNEVALHCLLGDLPAQQHHQERREVPFSVRAAVQHPTDQVRERAQTPGATPSLLQGRCQQPEGQAARLPGRARPGRGRGLEGGRAQVLWHAGLTEYRPCVPRRRLALLQAQSSIILLGLGFGLLWLGLLGLAGSWRPLLCPGC